MFIRIIENESYETEEVLHSSGKDIINDQNASRIDEGTTMMEIENENGSTENVTASDEYEINEYRNNETENIPHKVGMSDFTTLQPATTDATFASQDS